MSVTKAPSREWESVIERYIEHRQRPTWRGRTHDKQGRKLQDRLSPGDAAKLRSNMLSAVASAEECGVLPAPYPVKRDVFDRLLHANGLLGRPVTKCPKWLRELRKAAVLNACGYTCRYCGRTADGVLAQEGRTLRFEMDHRRARSRIADCNDFDMRNIVAACRSCNVLKGQMDEGTFRRELQSLARSVMTPP